MHEKKPWLKFYGNVPHELNFPKISMYESVALAVSDFYDRVAYDFMGTKVTYLEFKKQIDQCANALAALGLKKGERVTISMPTSPPGIICFYAVNKLGAVASMIHPLSTESEIEFYCKISKSRFALTMDMWLNTFAPAAKRAGVEKLLICKMQDYLPAHLAKLYWLKAGRKNPKIPTNDPMIVDWKKWVMKTEHPQALRADVNAEDLAVILYSGGTTGTPKGIMLSNYNFVTEGLMCANWVGMNPEYSDVLAMLPIFHGFGLGVCVNTALSNGGKCILVPMFEADLAAKMIKKRPNFMIGVPTLYEALTKSKKFNKSDLSCLFACFSGADTLPRVVKERFEAIVERQGGKGVKLLEGYGLTEAVTAIMAMPMGEYREGSIGIPFSSMLAKVVKKGTTEEAPVGEEGELCLHGPAVMLGYLDQPEETAEVLQKHSDGKIWLHTGDVVSMDNDGFFYFKLREKRMIKSSGMNVYPAQVEGQLYKHEAVDECCVIGIPDVEQVERVKAFVVLKKEFTSKAGPDMAKELITHCRKDLIKWSCPREVEFINEIPKTKVGKIAFTELQKREIERLRAEGKYTGEKAG
ncbi:MAG TPA: AMP-binding protein [Spirochaetota bacterium]|nr:AMP-binding protein [Spirochaetota bacterium]